MTTRESLIAAREQAGLSRGALARMLGVTRHHVSHVEMGRRNPSVALMRRWAVALKPSSPIWAAEDIERVSLQVKVGKSVLAKTRRAA
jgi:transcriptional regulator with XRE-family HTH domain